MQPPVIQLRNEKSGIMVVENFLVNPMDHRQFALQLDYEKRGSSGVRSGRYPYPEYKAAFERIIRRRIVDWDQNGGVNGCYQFCNNTQDLVYHVDEQQYAAILYLTPDAPVSSGTSFWRSRHTGQRVADGTQVNETFGKCGAYLKDPAHWELVDRVGNVFNRLVIWYGKYIHSATEYFGSDVSDSRLFQIFFFNCE